MKRKINFRIQKHKICGHCGQTVMFDNCLVWVEYYDNFVCGECFIKLYTGCINCGDFYLSDGDDLVKLEKKEGSDFEFEEGYVCRGCITKQEFVYCIDCGFLLREENVEFHDNLRKFICSECLEEDYLRCSFCDEFEHHNIITQDCEGRIRCTICAENIALCDHCGVFVYLEESMMHGEREYCLGCFDSMFRMCDICEEYFRIEDLTLNTERGEYCLSCGIDNNLYISDGVSVIKDYLYKPEAIKFREGRGDEMLHFGIEWEVENVRDRLSRKEMAKNLLKTFGNFAYYKTDSSLRNGFEIVTHPFTWQWFKKNKKMFENAASVLVDGGYASYDPGTCGIHIHLSKNAFVGDSHFFKFLKLFCENYGFVYKISQRDDKSTSGECQWGRCADESDQKLLLAKTKTKKWAGRYVALNLENDDTVEVRVFRGTLKIESFFKNIEFVKAVFEFTNVTGIKDVTVEKFVEYVGRKRKSYGNLWDFMVKKEMV